MRLDTQSEMLLSQSKSLNEFSLMSENLFQKKIEGDQQFGSLINSSLQLTSLTKELDLLNRELSTAALQPANAVADKLFNEIIPSDNNSNKEIYDATKVADDQYGVEHRKAADKAESKTEHVDEADEKAVEEKIKVERKALHDDLKKFIDKINHLLAGDQLNSAERQFLNGLKKSLELLTRSDKIKLDDTLNKLKSFLDINDKSMKLMKSLSKEEVEALQSQLDKIKDHLDKAKQLQSQLVQIKHKDKLENNTVIDQFAKDQYQLNQVKVASQSESTQDIVKNKQPKEQPVVSIVQKNTAEAKEGQALSNQFSSTSHSQGDSIAQIKNTLKNVQQQQATQPGNEVFKQLIKEANVVINNQKTEGIIDLKPDNLGKVHIKMTTENGKVQIQMLFEKESTKLHFDEIASQLKQTLEEQGLSLESFDLDFSQSQQFLGREAFWKFQNLNSSEGLHFNDNNYNLLEKEDLEIRDIRNHSMPNWLAQNVNITI